MDTVDQDGTDGEDGDGDGVEIELVDMKVKVIDDATASCDCPKAEITWGGFVGGMVWILGMGIILVGMAKQSS